MAPRSKKQSNKHPREPSLYPDYIAFTIPEHQAQFEWLSRLRFGQTQFPNMSALREIQSAEGMADEVEDILAVGSWGRLLLI